MLICSKCAGHLSSFHGAESASDGRGWCQESAPRNLLVNPDLRRSACLLPQTPRNSQQHLILIGAVFHAGRTFGFNCNSLADSKNQGFPILPDKVPLADASFRKTQVQFLGTSPVQRSLVAGASWSLHAKRWRTASSPSRWLEKERARFICPWDAASH